MKFETVGVDTSAVEVSNISSHGVWLLVDGQDFFLAYADFPWFRTATVEQIYTLQRVGPEHLYWSLLDVDLIITSIRQPEKFPVISDIR